MNVTVDNDLCIGCGVCEDVAPQLFRVKGGLAVVAAAPVSAAVRDACIEAMDACPTRAIGVED